MLQQQQTTCLFKGHRSFVSSIAEFAASGEDDPEIDDADSGLEDAVRTERDYVRQRLREELRREPTEQELDEWLRRHTEGY
ncbi:MAG TPA: hypothetical protein VF658_02795 [Pyrinomonadaceae bacterium]|jgi:hypothetical protein